MEHRRGLLQRIDAGTDCGHVPGRREGAELDCGGPLAYRPRCPDSESQDVQSGIKHGTMKHRSRTYPEKRMFSVKTGMADHGDANMSWRFLCEQRSEAFETGEIDSAPTGTIDAYDERRWS